MPIGPIFRAMNHNKTRVMLIILEIAVTLAIVTNCVNMIVDERKGMLVPSGFDDANLLVLRSAPFRAEFKETQYVNNNVDSDLRVIRAIPGVRSVVNTNFVPWQGGGSSGTFKVAGSKVAPIRSQQYYCRGDLFGALGMSLVEGRAFNDTDYTYEADKNAQPKTIIVTAALAQLLFKTQHVLGKQIDDGLDVYTIVGVTGRFYNPYGWPIHEYSIFFPAHVGSFARGTRFLVRAEPGAMKSVVAAMEPALLKSNDGRVVTTKTIAEIKDRFFSQARLVMKAMSVVIVILIFITALGIIGITSLSVSERTKQIGTRRALGATKGDILQHFILENWMVTTAGLLLGIIATYGLNFLLVTNVSGAKMDWRYIAVGIVLLWANGLMATIPPALRGARVSPAIATRSV